MFPQSQKSKGQTTIEYIFLVVGLIIFVILVYTLLRSNIINPGEKRINDTTQDVPWSSDFTIFYDNFDSGSIEQWGKISGDWQAKNLGYSQLEISLPEKSTIAGKTSWINYYAETKAAFSGSASTYPSLLGGIGGRVNRLTGGRYVCGVELTSATTAKLVLYRFTDFATYVALNSSIGYIFDSGQHVIAIKLNGNSVGCFLDQVEKVSYEDATPFRYGAISLENQIGLADFDSVRAKYVVGPNPIGPTPSAIPTPDSSPSATPIATISPTPTSEPSPTISPSPIPGTCSDGSELDSCKKDYPPVYCNSAGILINLCSKCGCAYLDICNADESCSSELGPFLNFNVTNHSITGTTATINWTTDMVANYSPLEIGRDVLYGANYSNFKKMLSHSLALTNLQQDSLYHYRINACTTLGCAKSADYTFKTLPELLIQNLTNGSITYSSAIISFKTSTPANYTLEYGILESYGLNKSSSLLRSNFSTSLTNLSNDTIYHYKITSCTNSICNSTPDFSFSTLTYPCKDSDSGIKHGIAGFVWTPYGTFFDSCQGNIQVEYFCEGEHGVVNGPTLKQVNATCTSCLDSICQAPYCSDAGYLATNETGTFYDTCNGINFYCNGTVMDIGDSGNCFVS